MVGIEEISEGDWPTEERTSPGIEDRFTNAVLLRIQHQYIRRSTDLGRRRINAEYDFNLLDIRRRNPLDVLLQCVGLAFIPAAILAGGAAQLRGRKADIPFPPMANDNLREVFRNPGEILHDRLP